MAISKELFKQAFLKESFDGEFEVNDDDIDALREGSAEWMDNDFCPTDEDLAVIRPILQEYSPDWKVSAKKVYETWDTHKPVAIAWASSHLVHEFQVTHSSIFTLLSALGK